MYLISEDSIFLSEFLKKEFKKVRKRELVNVRYLDMGTGSGILSETALKCGLKKENITAVDIDPKCVCYVKSKGFNTIQSNLFEKLKKEKFNIISFNAPYLPADKYDLEPDTTGGKEGDEVSLRFIKQAKQHVINSGKIFLLISSLTPFNRIKKFKPKLVARKKLFFEELLILEF